MIVNRGYEDDGYGNAIVYYDKNGEQQIRFVKVSPVHWVDQYYLVCDKCKSENIVRNPAIVKELDTIATHIRRNYGQLLADLERKPIVFNRRDANAGCMPWYGTIACFFIASFLSALNYSLADITVACLTLLFVMGGIAIPLFTRHHFNKKEEENIKWNEEAEKVAAATELVRLEEARQAFHRVRTEAETTRIFDRFCSLLRDSEEYLQCKRCGKAYTVPIRQGGAQHLSNKSLTQSLKKQHRLRSLSVHICDSNIWPYG